VTKRFEPTAVVLPLLGMGVMLLIWTVLSQTVAPDRAAVLNHPGYYQLRDQLIGFLKERAAV
jgi:hypothetical protein